jgi:hypothetical protein
VSDSTLLIEIDAHFKTIVLQYVSNMRQKKKNVSNNCYMDKIKIVQFWFLYLDYGSCTPLGLEPLFTSSTF